MKLRYRFLFEILFFLPLFFFTLGQSPNFTEGAIISSLLSGMLIATPLLGAVKYLALTKRSKWLKHPNLVIASVLLILLFFLTRSQPVILIAALFAIPILMVGFTINKYLGEIILGASLFAIYYLGINQFGIEQLLQTDLLLAIVTGATLFMWYRAKSLGKWDFLVFIVLFSVLSWNNETLPYLALFSIPVITRVSINVFKPNWRILGDVISGILIGAYFVYYFLFANHVIQALTGGL